MLSERMRSPVTTLSFLLRSHLLPYLTLTPALTTMLTSHPLLSKYSSASSNAVDKCLPFDVR